MADSAYSNDKTGLVTGLARLLAQHKGQSTVVLDMRPLGSWTDYFIIATATSSTHMGGLIRQVKEYLAEHGEEPLRRHFGNAENDWCLVDCGDFVVHVMSAQARAFYELERLWIDAPVLFDGDKDMPKP